MDTSRFDITETKKLGGASCQAIDIDPSERVGRQSAATLTFVGQ
jgi:hypothetical protein